MKNLKRVAVCCGAFGAALFLLLSVVPLSEDISQISKSELGPPEVEGPSFSSSSSCLVLQRALVEKATTPCNEADDWVPRLASALGGGGHWVYVDVGANKGYGISEMISMLTPVYPFSPDHIYRSLLGIYYKKGMPKSHFCGMCCDCSRPVFELPQAHQAASLKVFAFDISTGCYEFLTHVFQNISGVNVTLAAISEVDGSVMELPRISPFNEWGSLSDTNLTGEDGRVKISTKNLDKALPDGLHVDYLSIDAEGFDSHVLEGAARLLTAQRVTVLMFETHMQSWASPKYGSVSRIVNTLAQFGYRCLLPLQPLPSLPTSTHNKFLDLSACNDTSLVDRLKGWRNVVCFLWKNVTVRKVFMGLLHDPRVGYPKCPQRVASKTWPYVTLKKPKRADVAQPKAPAPKKKQQKRDRDE